MKKLLIILIILLYGCNKESDTNIIYPVSIVKYNSQFDISEQIYDTLIIEKSSSYLTLSTSQFIEKVKYTTNNDNIYFCYNNNTYFTVEDRTFLEYFTTGHIKQDNLFIYIVNSYKEGYYISYYVTNYDQQIQN